MDINSIIHNILFNMKNKNFRVLSKFLFLAAAFFSCSKESPVTGDQSTSTAIQRENSVTNNGNRLAPRHYGSISGVLGPAPAKASIIAFNGQYTSQETICNPDGSFELNNLVPGSYIIRINYVPVGANSYCSIAVQKIVEIAGNTTNL